MNRLIKTLILCSTDCSAEYHRIPWNTYFEFLIRYMNPFHCISWNIILDLFSWFSVENHSLCTFPLISLVCRLHTCEYMIITMFYMMHWLMYEDATLETHLHWPFSSSAVLYSSLLLNCDWSSGRKFNLFERAAKWIKRGVANGPGWL